MEIKSTTSFMNPYTVEYELAEGVMKEPKNHLVRNASAMKGHYTNEDALAKLIKEQNDPLHYEVFEGDIPQEYGHLIYGISKLQPGVVGDECFMTKGHYHTIIETGEIYLCLRGAGYMLMKTQDGQVRAEKMTRGSMVYVPPYWAHRSVNIGDVPLATFYVYPGDAGHNYGDIEKEGFIKRIFRRNGEVAIE